jgi:membrane protein
MATPSRPRQPKQTPKANAAKVTASKAAAAKVTAAKVTASTRTAMAHSPRTVILDREALQLAGLRAYHGFIRHRGLDSAAALSFFAALVLFPASLAIVSGFALLDDKTRAPADILRIVDSVAPHETVIALHGPITQLLSIPNAGYALAIGIALTVWTLSGYITAFGRAINTAYEVQEGRRWIPLRATMLAVAAVLVVIGAVIVLIVAGTPTVALAVAKTARLPGWTVAVWDLAKWPVLAVLAIVVVAVLYYYSPNVRHLRIRWVTLGALLAIVVWVLATTGFAIYVLNFSHYNRVYGWLGGAVVLLLWLYLSNLVVVFGAEMDAEIVRIRQLMAGIDAQDAIQLPLRSTRRITTLDRWVREDDKNGRVLLQQEDRKRATAGKKPKAGTK